MRAAISCVLALVASTANVAADSPRKAADAAFERGRQLMKEKKFAEACAAFEQSQVLDPQLGTLFNLADCEVELGKLATARARFRELARNDPNPDRRALSEQIANKLERRVPRLLVTIAAKPVGTRVLIDGVDSTALVGVATPVDKDEYKIEITAPGFRDWSTTIRVSEERKTVTVRVRLEPIDAVEAPTASETTTPDDTRRRYAKYSLIGGGAIVAGGLLAGGLAWRKWNQAQCTSCTGTEKRERAHDATVLGNISTVTVLVGLVPIGAGVYLWRTSRGSAAASADVGPDQVSFVLSGTF